VYFDDFKVEHVKSPVIESQNYYPFGLTFDHYQRENSVNNQFQYNGKELQDELSVGWIDYGARMFLPDIGRWSAVDREAERTYNWTPYRYAYDNPSRFFDTDGMTEEERQKAVEWARQYIADHQSLKYIQDGLNDCSGFVNLVLTAVGFPNLKTGEGEFRGGKNGVSQLARNTRQVDLLEAREGDILTMWSARSDHKGTDGGSITLV
jgi:RHS repeat-associated protein